MSETVIDTLNWPPSAIAALKYHDAEIERLKAWQREARAWLAQCLGYVTGEGPPSWDGIRAFLKIE